MADYGMKLTSTGSAKLAVALAGGAPIALAHMAFGDANGTAYTPTGGEAALAREVARVPLETLEPDPQNPPWTRATGVIPAATGGFFIREIGIYDAAGALFAVGRYPDTYKPMIAEGASFDAPVTVIMQVGSVSAVTLILDPSAVYATRDWVLANAEFFRVVSAAVTAPPGSPAPGQKWLVPTGATGAWALRVGLIALYRNAVDGYLYINPAIGCFASAADENAGLYKKTAVGWRSAYASAAETAAGTSTDLAVNPAGLKGTLDPIRQAIANFASVTMITTDVTLSAPGFYFVDTRANALTLTLPASPAAGTAFTLADPFNNWGAKAVSLARNGKTIMGQADDLTCDTPNLIFSIVYDGATWRLA